MESGKEPISQLSKKVSNISHNHCLGVAASDVFTAADIQIQKTITYNLQQLYPRAKIIGTKLNSPLIISIGEEDNNDDSYPFTQPYIQPDQID